MSLSVEQVGMELKQILSVIVALGGKATTAEIAAKLGWDKIRTLNRIKSATAFRVREGGARKCVFPELFRCEYATVVGQPNCWRLTKDGQKMAEAMEVAA